MQAHYPVFLADDHVIVRNGIKELIEHNAAYKVTRQYDNGRQLADDIATAGAPAVIVMDVAMPVMDGKATLEWLNAHNLHYPVLILTFDTSDKMIVDLFRMGARGYLAKTCSAGMLKRALDDIIHTGYYHNELLTNALAGNKKDERQQILDKITTKEMNFLRLVCDEQEYTYEQMADKMQVHRRTIDGYRESLFDKFNIKSKTGLVLFVIKYNLLHQAPL